MSIPRTWRRRASLVFLSLLLAACAGSPRAPAVVVLTPSHDNVIAYWDGIGRATVLGTAAAATTPEEKFPVFHADMATLHLAMYDAVSAIDGRYAPFAIRPSAPAAGASLPAAASAAAVGVLRVLFPDRGAYYQDAYARYLATIPAGAARDRGVALGAEVAAGMVALRANDGRATPLPAYVPGTAPGKFRGIDPILRTSVAIRPFALTSLSQFRPPPPPQLDSAAYAAAFKEVKAMGGAVSTSRTPAQFEVVRFHTEQPPPYISRNFGRLSRSTPDAADAARLMAMIYVSFADAIDACFEAKYHYLAWRPQSAVPLADSASNPATVADPAWRPSAPTPNHPEYPAAHSCTAGALGEVLYRYYGTDNVTYTFDSQVTGTTRTYTSTDALTEESLWARIHGGMHFRYSTTAGALLGKQVAGWVIDHHFGKRM